ncbi:hypothetical protein JCM18899A_02940 [Nocardioides sp. AN3]
MPKFELPKVKVDLHRIDPRKVDLHRIDPRKVDLHRIDPRKVDLHRIDPRKVDVPKPVYAGAGAAVVAVEALKEYVDTVSKRVTGYGVGVTSRVAGYQKQVVGFEPKAFADALQSRTTARVESLTAEAKARRTALESRVGGLQADAKAFPALVTSFYKETSSEARGAYDGFAKRGEVIVARLRREIPDEVVVTVEVDEPAAKKSATAKKAPAAKKTTAKKAPAKKATTKKTTTAKAAAATAPAEKAPVEKAASDVTPAAPATPAVSEVPPADALFTDTPSAGASSDSAPDQF